MIDNSVKRNPKEEIRPCAVAFYSLDSRNLEVIVVLGSLPLYGNRPLVDGNQELNGTNYGDQQKAHLLGSLSLHRTIKNH